MSEEGNVVSSELGFEACLGKIMGEVLLHNFTVHSLALKSRCVHLTVNVESAMSVTVPELVSRFLEVVHSVIHVIIRFFWPGNVRLIFQIVTASPFINSGGSGPV